MNGSGGLNWSFRSLALARALVSAALQVQAVALAWAGYRFTGDPMTLAWLGLSEAIPAVSGGLIAGWWVDRGRPHRIYLLALFALVANGAALFFLLRTPLSPSLLLALFAGSFVSGAARSFLAPAFIAMVPLLVPRADLLRASAFNQLSLQLASVAAPAAAGVLIADAGAPAAMALATSFLVGAAAILGAVPARVRAHRSRSDGALGWVVGARFVLGHKILLSAMTLDMVSVLFGGAVAILPAFTSEVLQLGARELGWLRSAPAAGALVMAARLNLIPLQRLSGRQLLAAVAGFGLATVAFGLCRSLETAWAALFFTGFFDALSATIRQGMLLVHSPAELRGRIASVSQMFIMSSNELGAFESGVAAKLLGVAPSVIFGGAVTLVTVLVTWRAAPELSRPAT